MPFDWKKKIVEPILEGLALLIFAAVGAYFGILWFFQTSLRFPTDLWDVLRLAWTCGLLAYGFKWIQGKINL